jgi:hypothetical protein
MVAPTNKAWNKAYATVSSFFKYVPEFEFMESVENQTIQKVKLDDAAAITDSIAKIYLAGELFYNNNIYDNKKLKNQQDGASLKMDSLMSTIGAKSYSEDAANLFAHTTRVDKSNGAIWVTADDSLHVRTWNLWNPELRFETEYSRFLAYVSNGSAEAVPVNRKNEEVDGKVSNNSYLEITPASKAVNPEVNFYLPGVRSTEYSAYIVFVPANINSKYYSEPLKKNHVEVTFYYADEKGKTKDITFKDIDPAVDSLQNVEGMTAKVDTTYIGDVTFPTSYVGMSGSNQTYAPYVRIRSRVGSKQTAIYDRTMRIDCIILRPKNLDTYIKEHPDYKYDRGL